MRNERTLPSRDVYQIKVRGILDPAWEDWFDGFEFQPQTGGDTLLIGRIVDQAALHGLLAKIRDLGLPLLFVKPVEGNRESDD